MILAIPGVTFNTKHTYDDFGLILSSYTISEPEPKTEQADVPGMDGILDLTESLGAVRYKNRTIKMVFSVPVETVNTFKVLVSSFANFMHGKMMKIIMDDEKDWYYQGRCTITDVAREKAVGKITVSCDVYPYKYDVAVNENGDWLWDPFSFVDGVIYPGTKTISGSVKVNLPNSQKEVVPTFVCSTAMTAIFNGTTYNLEEGINKNYDIVLSQGDNYVIFNCNGSGTVKIIYKGGSL